MAETFSSLLSATSASSMVWVVVHGQLVVVCGCEIESGCRGVEVPRKRHPVPLSRNPPNLENQLIIICKLLPATAHPPPHHQSLSMPRPSSFPRGPIIALGLTSSIAIGAVFWSHYSQVRDREAMKEGVERDKMRMKLKRQQKRERAAAAAAAAADRETQH